jgi:hypothetical protein
MTYSLIFGQFNPDWAEKRAKIVFRADVLKETNNSVDLI